MTEPKPVRPSPMSRDIVATITGPHGWLWRYHASYRIGPGKCESGSFALTRRGIERKARRVSRQLERQERIYNARRELRSPA